MLDAWDNQAAPRDREVQPKQESSQVEVLEDMSLDSYDEFFEVVDTPSMMWDEKVVEPVMYPTYNPVPTIPPQASSKDLRSDRYAIALE